jgi:hypothetical protein
VRALVSPVVTEKVRSFDEVSKRELSTFIERISVLTPDQFEDLRRRSQVLDAAKNIFSYREHFLHVFYVTGEANGNPYLLVLDVVPFAQRPMPAVANSDPRINSKFNPYVNSAINPLVNSVLNPFVNSALNPYVNTSLNPYVNTALNPFVNTTLNPFVNTAINCFANTALNPSVNSTLNPYLNPYFTGLRFYDLNLAPQGFAVEAADSILLRFDPKLQFLGIGVRNGAGGYTLFDAENAWTGYLVPDQQGGFLMFDVRTGWSGIVTS